MKTTIQRIACPLAFLLLTTACGQPTPPPTEETVADSAEASHHGDIAWFEGSVDEAFALAKTEGKPVFMYWGAIWCPPCHYLKSKIFTQPSFQARLESFVPIYLDGDTERAQILGEEYQTAGYPTVIVFDSAGEEVMRLDSMIPVESYTEVLENAMNATQPIAEVVARVQAAPIAEVSQADLNLLAFYSWGQAARLDLEDGELAALFARLWRETPVAWPVEKTRFLALYLTALDSMAGDEEAPEPAWTDDERAELVAAVEGLLADPLTRNTNLELATYWSTETVDLLAPMAGAAREGLKSAFEEAAVARESDPTLSVSDRLGALYPRIFLARLPDAKAAGSDEEGEAPPLPEDLLAHVRERIAWAGETVRDENELQAVMNTMAGLLSEADLVDEAESLLSERYQDAVAPYYFMSWLASIKKETGETDEAVRLYRQAWQAAEGNYTRFRWGSTYLRNLVALQPENAETLQADGQQALAELLEHEEAFAGGNWSRLQSLSRALQEWNEDGQGTAVLEAFRDQVHAVCERYPAEEGEDSPGQRCRSFLATAA